ncbi:MAG: sulfite exporter TauE/SafE family protein [Vicinamibacterales bacterium]
MTHDAGIGIDLLGFLMLGLLGSVAHCVGMCSPFVMVVSRHYTVPLGRHAAAAAQLWYTAGRIVTYALLGAVAGTVGHAVDLAGALIGVQRAAAAMAGALLVTWALVTLLDLGGRAPRGGALFARLSRAVKGRIPPHPLLLGLFLGLLPCGLLYSAVIAATSRGSALGGATALAVFGAATAPALLGVSIADQWLGRQRPYLNRVSQAFVLVMGLWYLWKGLVA